MLVLGDIVYSNCFPVHAAFIDCGPPADVRLVRDIPSKLNALLAAGEIDVAPCSSIEFAQQRGRYRVLPDFVIGSDGPVHSIRFAHSVPIEELDGRTVALPTASATSVVLLRILLEQRYHVRPRFEWFDQSETDPFQAGCAAALFIGDVALRRSSDALDLGAEWRAWTGLPFAFAIWQIAAPPARDDELRALHRSLTDSYRYFELNAEALAERHADRYGVPASVLLPYWRSLQYRLDDRMQAGLREFYRRAAEIGALEEAPELTWFEP